LRSDLHSGRAALPSRPIGPQPRWALPAGWRHS
jgi:hypothetical protein